MWSLSDCGSCTRELSTCSRSCNSRSKSRVLEMYPPLCKTAHKIWLSFSHSLCAICTQVCFWELELSLTTCFHSTFAGMILTTSTSSSPSLYSSLCSCSSSLLDWSSPSSPSSPASFNPKPLYERYTSVTWVLHERYRSVTRALHQRYTSVTRALHEHYTSIYGRFLHFLTFLHIKNSFWNDFSKKITYFMFILDHNWLPYVHSFKFEQETKFLYLLFSSQRCLIGNTGTYCDYGDVFPVLAVCEPMCLNKGSK